MALAHPLALPAVADITASASWPLAEGGGNGNGGGVPPALAAAVLRLEAPPGSAPPCEVALAPAAAVGSPPLQVALTCSARLVELRLQGALDREPLYTGTLRGEAAPAAAPDAAAGGEWRFRLDLPAGWRGVRLKLLSLADKGAVWLAAEAVPGAGPPAGAPAPAGAGSAAAEVAGGPAAAAAPLSQLDELRLFVQHAAAGVGGVPGAGPLPPSLRLLQDKLEGSSGTPGAAAAQALGVAVAKAALLEGRVQQEEAQQAQQQRQQQQQRDVSAAQRPEAALEAPAGASAVLTRLEQQLQEQAQLQRQLLQEMRQHAPLEPPERGRPLLSVAQRVYQSGSSDAAATPLAPPAAGGFSPSADALWLADRFEASVAAAEARLQAGLGGLAARVAALEARLAAAEGQSAGQ